MRARILVIIGPLAAVSSADTNAECPLALHHILSQLSVARSRPSRNGLSHGLPIPADMLEQTRALAENGEDGYEFSSSRPNAGLGIRYNVRTQVEVSSASSWGRIYCRLNLIDVTTSKLSIHQIVPCDADWIAEAKRVRSYVEGLFSSGDVSKEPSETRK